MRTKDEFMGLPIPDKVRIIKNERDPNYIKYILSKYLPNIDMSTVGFKVDSIRGCLGIKGSPSTIYEIVYLAERKGITIYRSLFDESTLSLVEFIEKLK